MPQGERIPAAHGGEGSNLLIQLAVAGFERANALFWGCAFVVHLGPGCPLGSCWREPLLRVSGSTLPRLALH